MALALVVEVDGVELIDDLAQQLAILHAFVDFFKDAAHHIAEQFAHWVGGQVFKGDEEFGVDEVLQVITRDAIGVGGLVAPAHGLRVEAFAGSRVSSSSFSSVSNTLRNSNQVSCEMLCASPSTPEAWRMMS